MSEAKETSTSCSFDPDDQNSISPYLKELKVILSDLVARREAGRADYLGGSEGKALYKDKDLAVQLSILEKGEIFPEHFHPIEKEWLILVKGSATMQIDGVEKKLKARDSIILEPETNHCGVVEEDSIFVCVAIPADEGYPDVGN